MFSSKAASAGMTTDNGGGDKAIVRRDIGLVKGTTMPSFKKGMTLLVTRGGGSGGENFQHQSNHISWYHHP
jgi:hypothetical protein